MTKLPICGTSSGERFSKIKADKIKRMHKYFDEIPAINWEILKYANHHDKSECLLEYPEHEKFISSIRFNT